MCKKSLLMMLLLALFAPWAANAQTRETLTFDFEDNAIPSTWTNDADYPWVVVSESQGSGHSGTYCIKSGNSGVSSSSSTISATFNFNDDGTISFLGGCFGEGTSTAWDKCIFSIDGTQQFAYGARQTWETYTFNVTAGEHTFTWSFTKDSSVNATGDAFFVDDIVVDLGEVPACPKPTDVAATDPTAYGATISWTGTSDSYILMVAEEIVNADYDFETGEIPAAFTNDANYPWTVVENTHSGAYCAKSATGNNSATTALELQIIVPSEATLTFSAKVSSESGYDMAYFSIDGTPEINGISGSGNWIDYSYTLAAGTHTLRWYYTKDSSVASNDDCFYVDDILISSLTAWDESHTASASPYTFTDLNSGTTYQVMVKGVCGSEQSQPSAAVRFTTLELCTKPTDLTVSDVTARTAELSWTSDGTAWEVEVVGEYTTTWNASAIPFTLPDLEPETVYTVRVRTVCDTEVYSGWSTPVSFTTEPSCYAPTDMVISDITAYSANVAWTSENTNFDMRYTTDLDPNNDFETSSLRGWTNIDADGDGYVWVLGSEAAGVYHNDGVDVTGNGHNSSYDFIISGSFTNAGGTALTPDNYLVSPQITLGGSISFWAQSQDANYCEEHFGVAVSTTSNTDPDAFTTIAEWTITNDSKGAVLREANRGPRGGNRDQTEWIQYTVNLREYAGETGYVAIRHFNCEDQFLLNLDDIVIEQPGGFQVNWTDVTNVTNPQTLTNLDDATTYVVQVRANCGGDNGVSRWLEGTFTTLPACMVPTGLVVSNIDKRSADLAWIANGDETQWQICLNGDETNLITVSDTSYSFTNLTPETRYTVKVRAYCDETLQSAWSSPAVFTTLVACPAPTALAISDITNVSAVASWTGEGDFELQYAEDVWKYYDNGVYATTMGAGGTIYWGMMLPAESLTAGEPLTKVALHTSYAGEATLNVYLGGDQPTGTPAATQTFTMAGDGDFMEITLDTPVAIDGTQNLWITFYQSGLTYAADGCTGPTDPNGRWVSLDGEEWADIAGYGYDYTWMIRAAFGNNTQTEWVTIDNATSPQAITGLTPETDYLVRVKHVCGGIDGESVWVNTSFTTDEACPAPTALAATPYALSAELSWDEGEGYSESYTVSYREPAVMSGIDEKFATTSVPTGWTRYNTLLTDDVLNGTTALTTNAGGWYFGTNNGVFDSHARVNIYGTSCKYWLVTPAIAVPSDAEFSFDLALTAYSGTGAASGTCVDDRFDVLVSTDDMATWTILREWNNADGAEYVYNDIPTAGTNVSFDFSAYAGQTVYIAFYGESTVGSNGDNNLHIDNVNVTVVELVPATAWETVDVDEATALITGLTPETKYEWKVQGNCGDYGLSEESVIATFTTTNDLCPVPTNLTVVDSLTTATTADLRWNGSPDVESFTVRYRAPEHSDGGLYEPFNVSGVPTGWTRYSGLVNDVIAGTATLATTTSGWYTNTYALGSYNMKVNIYGTSCKYWLVTPEVTPVNGNFTFDLALTKYNSSDAIANDTLQADDRFVVLVYADSTWTILREWNNSGSDYVYNTISATGQQVSIDLSAYVGQAIKIAFYGESTNPSGVANIGGDNDLHIDNVLIGTLIPATDWMTVENITDMNVTLTGLTPKTPYEAQVQNVCSPDSIWSNTVTFTTLEQTIVTQTLALSNTNVNYCSFYVDITLADLQTALTDALGTGSSVKITIKSKEQTSSLSRGRWTGQLTSLDLGKMYKISVSSACEITLEGMMVDPAEHPVSIPGAGIATWIAFPFSTNMTLTDAFAGFAVNGDIVKSKANNASYTRNRWNGALQTLEPGQGYIYKSAANATDRTFTYPTSKK